MGQRQCKSEPRNLIEAEGRVKKRWILCGVSANCGQSFLSLYLTSVQLCPSSHPPSRWVSPLSYRGKKKVQLFSAIQSARVSTNLTRSPSFTQFLCLPPSVSHCSGLVPVSTALSCPCSTRHTAQLRTAEADSGVGARERETGGGGVGGWGGLGGRQGENEHRKLRRKQQKQREG